MKSNDLQKIDEVLEALELRRDYVASQRRIKTINKLWNWLDQKKIFLWSALRRNRQTLTYTKKINDVIKIVGKEIAIT